MSNKNEKPLKVLIDKMLRAYGYGPKLDEIGLVKSWEGVVGKMIANHTTDIYFKDGDLHVKIDSAPLRQELAFAKSKLIEKLNQEAGKRLVKNINFR